MAVAYLDAYRGAFGVQPICRVLTQHGMPVAASTYYAARARPASGRSVRDGQLMTQVKRVFKDSGEVYGARKVWRQLHREGTWVGQCACFAPADAP